MSESIFWTKIVRNGHSLCQQRIFEYKRGICTSLLHAWGVVLSWKATFLSNGAVIRHDISRLLLLAMPILQSCYCCCSSAKQLAIAGGLFSLVRKQLSALLSIIID